MAEKAIYKIENKINHKIYIGQSKNPEQRFQNHISRETKYCSLIHKAIQKYGVENFSFEIIGWFEDYNEKEKYYIQYYRSLVPNGYNIATRGENLPIMYGENNPVSKITKEVVDKIIEDLKNFSIPRKQILKKYNISNDMIRHINEGSSWRRDSETYPLRPNEKDFNLMRVEEVIRMILLTDIPLNQIGSKVGWSRSAAKMINQGKNHFNSNLIYPLRNNKEKNIAILNL